MSIVFALFAMSGWATSDYLGGITARKIGSSVLTFYTQIFGAFFLLPVLAIAGGRLIGHDMWLGMLGGVFNAIAFILLMEGITKRRIGSVIPVSAVAQTLLTVTVGVIDGDSLNWASGLGIILAIFGVVLVSSEKTREPTETRKTKRTFDLVALGYGIGSGILFGCMFVVVAHTSKASGVWPVISMRSSIVVIYAFCRINSTSVRTGVNGIVWAAITAATGTLALAAYATGVRIGSLAIVSTIGSTSPAGTVAIAHFIGHERVSRSQSLGVLVSVIGVVLLSIA
jgi:drug/metabolite transporter (DMT)-like permease